MRRCKSKQFLLFYISLSSVTKCPCPPGCSGSKRVLKGAAQSAEVWIGLCYTAPTIHLLPIDDREGQGDLGSDRGQNRTFCSMYTSMYIIIGHSTMWPPDEVCMRTPAFQKALRVHMLRKISDIHLSKRAQACITLKTTQNFFETGRFLDLSPPGFQHHPSPFPRLWNRLWWSGDSQTLSAASLTQLPQEQVSGRRPSSQ